MAKYSFEFKMKIVKEYLTEGIGYRRLAEKYSLGNKTIIQNWVNSYNTFGESGLKRKKKNEIYTIQTKLNAVLLYQEKKMSIREIANYFDINNPGTIASWLLAYRNGGKENLSRTRGRQQMKKVSNKTLSNTQLAACVSSLFFLLLCSFIAILTLPSFTQSFHRTPCPDGIGAASRYIP